jgi:hypothetical protein
MKTKYTQVGGAVMAPVTQHVNVRAVRQSILDQLDNLPPSKWQRGIHLSGGSAPVIVTREERFVVVTFRGQQLARTRVSPDKHKKIQPDSRNREAVEKALTQIVQTNPEVAQIMANQV